MRRFESTALPVALMSVAVTGALLLASRAYASGDETWWRAADCRYRVAVSGGLGYSVPAWEWFDGFTSGPSVDVSAKCSVDRKWFVGVKGCRQGLGVEPRLTRPVQIGVDPDGVPVYADVSWHVALNELYGLCGGMSHPAGDRRPVVSYEVGLGAIRHEVRVTLRHAGAQVTEMTHDTKVAFLFGAACTVPVGRRLGLEGAGSVRLTGHQSANDADPQRAGVLYGVRLGLVLLLGGASNVAGAPLRGLGGALQAAEDEAIYSLRVDLFAPSLVGGSAEIHWPSQAPPPTPFASPLAPPSPMPRPEVTPATPSTHQYWNLVTRRGYLGDVVARSHVTDGRASPTIAIPAANTVRVKQVMVERQPPALEVDVQGNCWSLDAPTVRARLDRLSPDARALADSLVQVLAPLTFWPTQITSRPLRELLTRAGTMEVVTSRLRFEFDEQEGDVIDAFRHMWPFVFVEPCPIRVEAKPTPQ